MAANKIDIPDGWEVKKLGDLLIESKIKGNKGHISKKITLKLWGKGIVEKKEKMKGSSGTQYYIRKKGQFIYSKLDFLNQAFAVIPQEFDGFETTTDLPCFDIDKKLNSTFLLEYMKLPNTYKYYGKLFANGGRKARRVQVSDFLKLKFLLPPLAEQEKIAEILSLWDKAIEQTKELIAYKEKQKKGLMQNLLTGKKRLPGFTADWKTTKLVKVLKERNIYAEKNGTYNHVSLTKSGIIQKNEKYDRDYLVTKQDKEYKITQKNDICYNPANLKFGVICKNNYGVGIFSPIYITFEVNSNYNNDFIAFVLTQQSFIDKIRKYEEGTVYERKAVKPKDFLLGNILIPTLDEQKAIADILCKADEEIELLKKQLDLYTEQKKGLMQNLLTGKIRVKV